MGLPNKGIPITGLFVYDKDIDRWVPLSLDITPTGELLVTSYNRSSFYTGILTIVSAGTGQQGPTVQVPAGFGAIAKARDTNAGNIFVAPSKNEVEQASSRIIISPGTAVKLYVTNLNLMWFNGANSNDVVELFVET